MSNRFQAVLTQGSIGKALYQMTVPMIWGMLSMMAYMLADTFFVSRLGTYPLAAMGFIFPVELTLSHVALGLGIGVSSVLSRAIGEGDAHKVRRITTDSLLLSMIVVAVMAWAGFLSINPLFKIMGADDQTMGYIRQYMVVWYSGVIFLVVPMIGNHAIRASGDTFVPSLIMVFGSVMNIILDPIMIFGYFGFPAMGISGAALATVMSRMLTLVLALWVLHFNKRMIDFQIAPFKVMMDSWAQVMYVGIPSALTLMVPTISLAILTWMVSDFGQKAVAGFAVAGRVEGLAIVIFMALSTVFGPFIGQNWGARQYSRVRRALTKSFNFTLIFGFVQAVILFFLAKPIAGIFDRDPEVMKYAVLYIQIVPASYCFVTIVHLCSSAFNALGQPLPASILMAVRLLVFHLPLAYLGKHLFGFVGFLSATYIASSVAAVWAVLWIRRVCKVPLVNNL